MRSLLPSVWRASLPQCGHLITNRSRKWKSENIKEETVAVWGFRHRTQTTGTAGLAIHLTSPTPAQRDGCGPRPGNTRRL